MKNTCHCLENISHHVRARYVEVVGVRENDGEDRLKNDRGEPRDYKNNYKKDDAFQHPIAPRLVLDTGAWRVTQAARDSHRHLMTA